MDPGPCWDQDSREYAKDVASFDAVHQHILHMADVLTNGIVKQFPPRFAS
jgi:hypothetical protein